MVESVKNLGKPDYPGAYEHIGKRQRLYNFIQPEMGTEPSFLFKIIKNIL